MAERERGVGEQSEPERGEAAAEDLDVARPDDAPPVDGDEEQAADDADSHGAGHEDEEDEDEEDEDEEDEDEEDEDEEDEDEEDEDEEDEKTNCSLCSKSVADEDVVLANGRVVCPECAEQLQREFAAGQVTTAMLPWAIVGGAVGALGAAAVWAAIGIATEYEIGYLAVLVGFLAGYGTKRGSKGAHGPVLQKIAVVWSIFGLLAAKYFMFAYFAVKAARTETGLDISFVNPAVIHVFVANIGEMLGVFDLLWVVLAIGAAWRAAAPPRLVISA